MSPPATARYLLIFCLSFGLANSGPAATRFVAPEGNDAAEGSQAAPWRTLQHAADQLKPGDVLRVGHGEYREALVLHRGGTSADLPIVIEAAPGARPVISGADVVADGWRAAADAEVFEHDWKLPMTTRSSTTPTSARTRRGTTGATAGSPSPARPTA